MSPTPAPLEPEHNRAKHGGDQADRSNNQVIDREGGHVHVRQLKRDERGETLRSYRDRDQDQDESDEYQADY